MDGVKTEAKDQRLDKLYNALLPSKGLGAITADQVRQVKEKFNLPSLEDAERVLSLKGELDLIEKAVIKVKARPQNQLSRHSSNQLSRNNSNQLSANNSRPGNSNNNAGAGDEEMAILVEE